MLYKLNIIEAYYIGILLFSVNKFVKVMCPKLVQKLLKVFKINF
jgi:hypothetical protein